MADLHSFLHQLLAHRGSDLHLKVGAVGHVRVDGRLVPLLGDALTATDVDAMVRQVVPAERLERIDRLGDLDFALSVPSVGRFRINVHRQRGSYGVVVRCVPPGLPNWEQLALPRNAQKLVEVPNGLVIVAGPAGSGRSTTAAMLVDQVNATRATSIVTLEDPIEVLHSDKRSIISQREVGDDTPSFEHGLAKVMRQDCDVVYVSDIADHATAAAILAAASGGRLVITTIRAASSFGVIHSFLDLFPESQRSVVRRSLAASLRGISVQHLIERADGLGRVPAVEILVGIPKVIDLIGDASTTREQLDKAIQEGTYHGMQTLDQGLYELSVDGIVRLADAIGAAVNPEELRIALNRAGLAVA